MKKNIFLILVLLLVFSFAQAQSLTPVKLPAPDTLGGKPLMQALKERKSSRQFSPRELPAQVLADLLWAAYGINRPDSGGRTAPSAHDSREFDIYVIQRQGAYLFDAAANTLIPVSGNDLRPLTGKQDFVATAPVNLIFVADQAKAKMDPGTFEMYTSCDAGFISQNVYLYCASAGLVTVVRGWLDKEPLAKALKLGPGKSIVLAQTVGYPPNQ